MGDRLGSDVSCFVVNEDGLPDLDPNFRLIDGPRSIVESVAKMWTTQRGTLITNTSRGIDVREWLSSEIDPTPAGLAPLVQDLTAEALRDERVRRISVRITVDELAESMRIEGEIDPADESGPFAYVLEIDKVTPKILLPEAA